MEASSIFQFESEGMRTLGADGITIRLRNYGGRSGWCKFIVQRPENQEV
jgi:hypothetical protein